MNVRYSCPNCDRQVRLEVPTTVEDIACPQCGHRLRVPAGAIVEGTLCRCLVCPSSDLFVRKDFPQRLGVMIVTLGFAASCVTWAYTLLYWTFAILFATALVDVLLYVIVPDALMCYRCGALYRGAPGQESHAAFDLEIHERHRQQRSRLAQAQQVHDRQQAGSP